MKAYTFPVNAMLNAFAPVAPGTCSVCDGIFEELLRVSQGNQEFLKGECEECGHEIELHFDRYGCQVERGDRWVEDINNGAWMAAGPCGCNKYAEHFKATETRRQDQRRLADLEHSCGVDDKE